MSHNFNLARAVVAIQSMRTSVVSVKVDYDQYIGRPSYKMPWMYGNPFTIGKDGGRREVIRKYGRWLVYGDTFENEDATDERRVWILNHINELKGKRLGCWCRPLSCHGDILVLLAENDGQITEPLLQVLA